MVDFEKEKALRTFDEIAKLKEIGLWNNIANRLYYSAFHAVSALLISSGHSVGTHQGAVVQLNQFYVKTGLISQQEGSFYSQLQALRERADYNCTYYATESDITPRIEETRLFINHVISLIEKHN